MGTLLKDIKLQSDWIVKAIGSDGYNLDYSIESMREIDKFFIHNMENGKPKKGGRIPQQGFGSILFSLGAYVGETIIKNIDNSSWIIDDNDTKAEINAAIKLPSGSVIYPMQKLIKRFSNGEEDAIYPYVYIVMKDFKKATRSESGANLAQSKVNDIPSANKKAWWKFW